MNKFQSLCFGDEEAGEGGGGVSISNFFCNDQEVSSIFNVKLYDLVVLLENVGKQTESQTDRQTDNFGNQLNCC